MKDYKIQVKDMGKIITVLSVAIKNQSILIQSTAKKILLENNALDDLIEEADQLNTLIRLTRALMQAEEIKEGE